MDGAPYGVAISVGFGLKSIAKGLFQSDEGTKQFQCRMYPCYSLVELQFPPVIDL